MCQVIQLLDKLETKRTGRPLSAFSKAYSPERAAELLASSERPCFEYLRNREVNHGRSKVYLDSDQYFDTEPSASAKAERDALVHRKCEAIVSRVSELARLPPGRLSYVVATRHGPVTSGKAVRYKLSYRVYFQGVTLDAYWTCADVLGRVCPAEDLKTLWDLSVYKKEEQAMGAINALKSSKDPRRLVPQRYIHSVQPLDADVMTLTADELLKYTVTWVDPSWPVLEPGSLPQGPRMSLALPPSPNLQEGSLPVGAVPASLLQEPDTIVKLLMLLNKSRWDDYRQWRDIATVLKNEHGDKYLPEFLRLSQLSPKYSDSAARELWTSVARPDYDGPRLHMATLEKWACEDNRAGYTVYRASKVPPIVSKEWENGDVGLAKIACDALKPLVKRTGKQEYFTFDEASCKWCKTDDGRILSLLSSTLETRLRDLDVLTTLDISQCTDERQRKEYDEKKARICSLIRYVQKTSGLSSVLRVAGSFLHDSSFVETLDSIPYLLGLTGGKVVDLRSGTVRWRVPEDLVYNEVDVEYKGPTRESSESASWFNKIVVEMMGGDETLARYLQLLLGYGITGEVCEEIFMILTGSGRNGKSLLLQALESLLGSLYANINCAVISGSRTCSNVDAERAKLLGTRIAMFNELKQGEKINCNELQLLTGGDTIPAKPLYKDPLSIKPRHLVGITTNWLPEFSDGVIASMAERVLVINFPVTFVDLGPGEEETETRRRKDRTLKQRLTQTAEGRHAVFSWLVEGSVAWYSLLSSGSGLKAVAPSSVRQHTSRYLSEQDRVQVFLNSSCVLDAQSRVSSSALYDAYRAFDQDNTSSTGKWFHSIMRSKGFLKKTVRLEGDVRCQGYDGIGLRVDIIEEAS